MNNPDPAAHDPVLSALLRAARPAMTPAPRFQEAVWHRIDRAAAPAQGAGWIARLAGLVLQPRFAGAVSLLIIVMGASFGAIHGSAAAREDAQARYVAAVSPNTTH